MRYIPQVDLGRVINNGDGWLDKDELCLISTDDLYKINDIISQGRKCEFKEGHELCNDGKRMHHWLRWFHVPMSYLISLDVLGDTVKFEQVKSQLSRYMSHLMTVIYPTYRKNDQYIDWNIE